MTIIASGAIFFIPVAIALILRGCRTGKLNFCAITFTGGGVKICLRPTSASGAVINAAILKRSLAMSASRVGTEKSGVPMKIILYFLISCLVILIAPLRRQVFFL